MTLETHTTTPALRQRLRVLVWVSSVLLAVTLGACGVRTDDEPRKIAATRVPYGLLDKGASPAAAPTPTTAPRAKRVAVTVYFLSGGRLVATVRTVAEPATPLRMISALLDGPTEEEALAGVRSAVSPTTDASVTRGEPGVVVVGLSNAFAEVPSQEQRLALGQIVFTVTELPGVTGVRFTLAGAPVEVPLPDGTLTSAPVGRAAFGSLAPPQRPPTVAS